MKHSLVPVQSAADPIETPKKEALHLRKIIDEVCSQLDRITIPEGEGCFVNSAVHKQVRAVIRARRARAQFFEATLFADPAWDMLLELFASELGTERMSVTALCAGAAVPPTTALRWIPPTRRPSKPANSIGVTLASGSRQSNGSLINSQSCVRTLRCTGTSSAAWSWRGC